MTSLIRGNVYGGSLRKKLLAIRYWAAALGLRPKEKEDVYGEFCRIEIFERLGMAHTCCSISFYRQSKLTDDEELLELRSEDEELSKQLESWMGGYFAARLDSSGDPFEFCVSWWKKRDADLPPVNVRARVEGADMEDAADVFANVVYLIPGF